MVANCNNEFHFDNWWKKMKIKLPSWHQTFWQILTEYFLSPYKWYVKFKFIPWACSNKNETVSEENFFLLSYSEWHQSEIKTQFLYLRRIKRKPISIKYEYRFSVNCTFSDKWSIPAFIFSENSLSLHTKTFSFLSN